ncbi:MAG: hypothetical protein RML37_12535, partial [Chitinophagales bacterium]|nr:hypothetical protein [Chitinophagales bacterium]
TTAIQLQNAGGTSILNLDAVNNRVGIGLTNPGHVLHVTETGSTGAVAGIQVDETNAGQAVVINESGTGAGLLINASDDGGGIVSTVSASVTNSVVGHQFIDARQTTTAGIDKIAVDIQSTGTWTGNANNALNVIASGGNTNVGINVTVSGGTTRYAGLFNGGNVGIGTTTPAHVLHVVETADNGSIHGVYINESNAGQALVIDEVGNGAGILLTANDNGAAISSTVQGAVTAAAQGHIFSDTRTSSTASIAKTAVAISSTGTWNGAGAVNRGLTVDVSGGATNYAALFNGGNVGIGTTSPVYALETRGPDGTFIGV